jgi:branched-chain amino acid transport system ATP-binding protein
VLDVARLTTRYGPITALRGVSLHVDAGEVVAIIGPNGAGKTTLLASIAGLLKPAAGTVTLRGHDVTRHAPDVMLRHGVALVPERRRIFAEATVADNLSLGGYTVSRSDRAQRLEEMCELFPVLAEKRDTRAGYLSGGEAQQLAIGRALMSDPELLLMDEPALGLAPALVEMVMDLIVRLRSEGRTIVVVEQNVQRVLGVCDRAYVLRTGTVADEGAGADLLGRTDLFAAYVGPAAASGPTVG